MKWPSLTGPHIRHAACCHASGTAALGHPPGPAVRAAALNLRRSAVIRTGGSGGGSSSAATSANFSSSSDLSPLSSSLWRSTSGGLHHRTREDGCLPAPALPIANAAQQEFLPSLSSAACIPSACTWSDLGSRLLKRTLVTTESPKDEQPVNRAVRKHLTAVTHSRDVLR